MDSSSANMVVLWGGVAVLLAFVSYLSLPASKSPRSRKAQQAIAMRQAYESIRDDSESSKKSKAILNGKSPHGSMQISQLWVYPIKSIRGCQVPKAILTQEGFYLDRRFMLLKDHQQTPCKLENMAIAHFPQMCLFHVEISSSSDTLIVSYRSPGTTSPQLSTLEIPLEPDSYEGLERLEINMHGSPTTGYDMGDKCNKWFSERFGFKVILAHWGGNPRLVLGNLPGKPANQGPKSRNSITKIMTSIPVIGRFLGDDDGVIAFNDCAPYLVISESSVADATSRLPDDVEMDLTKFRANIVLKSSEPAYAEDFWGELIVGDEGARIILTGNCGRCVSLTVDYTSGKAGAGRDGRILKLLQKDRRVDLGMKYSPIFGRYGFASKGSGGMVVNVGDEVVVSKRNEKRTRFYWPGIST